MLAGIDVYGHWIGRGIRTVCIEYRKRGTGARSIWSGLFVECASRPGKMAVVIHDADRASGVVRGTSAADSQFLG